MLPAYQGQMPIWTVQQAHPIHTVSGKSYRYPYEANQGLQHRSLCPPQVLSPVALQSKIIQDFLMVESKWIA